MKSIYPVIKSSATKHPYQWTVAKFRIKERVFLFPVDTISVILETVHTLTTINFGLLNFGHLNFGH